jgi:hypothetical protein
MNGFWPYDTPATRSGSRVWLQRRCVRTLVEESARSVKTLYAIPECEAGSVRITMVPVQQKAGRSQQVKKEAKTKIPGQGEVAHGEGHSGRKTREPGEARKGAEPETGAGF